MDQAALHKESCQLQESPSNTLDAVPKAMCFAQDSTSPSSEDGNQNVLA